MTLAHDLAGATGAYFGTGDGIESGPFVARIVISRLPGGGALIDYEATSREQGVQHVERSMLSQGPDGLDELFVAHSESPVVTTMVATEAGAGRFEQRSPTGPYRMAIVIELPEADRLTYAWWWGTGDDEPVERSKADVRLHL